MDSAGEAEGVTWARVDDGFYVGSVPGRFLGCIDRAAEGEFHALDVHARPIGTYADLHSAMRAVQNAATEQASA